MLRKKKAPLKNFCRGETMQNENAKQIYIPENGKQQVKLQEFGYKPEFRNYYFTIYLPCAKTKPYKHSKTHKYITAKLKQFIPKVWLRLIHISTISEVLGIVPRSFENLLFITNRQEFYYEHYPRHQENDIQRTAEWLRNYIVKFGTTYNYAYCTSRVFRKISKRAGLQCFPTIFSPSSALFEFRRKLL